MTTQPNKQELIITVRGLIDFRAHAEILSFDEQTLTLTLTANQALNLYMMLATNHGLIFSQMAVDLRLARERKTRLEAKDEDLPSEDGQEPQP